MLKKFNVKYFVVFCLVTLLLIGGFTLGRAVYITDMNRTDYNELEASYDVTDLYDGEYSGPDDYNEYLEYQKKANKFTLERVTYNATIDYDATTGNDTLVSFELVK